MSVKETVALWLAKRKLKQLEKEGRMGWLGKNRSSVGGFLVALGTALRAVPEAPHVVIELLTFAGTFLVGGGMTPSDAAKREFGDQAR